MYFQVWITQSTNKTTWRKRKTLCSNPSQNISQSERNYLVVFLVRLCTNSLPAPCVLLIMFLYNETYTRDSKS